ncbi:MAG: NAD(P)H-hydrate dehydratase [Parcubacteria group bacterium]|nr:NAD(P)H-hydrate dehydratase [Parcubacteria group bacterium]
MSKVTKDLLQTIYPPRPSEVRKYDYGLLLVIGGSDFYSGAPALSALAAFKAGLDMVRIIAPKRAADIIASFSPVLAAYPIANTRVLKNDLPLLLEMTASAKATARGNVAVLIGGGMGRTEETLQTIADYLAHTDIPAVIDADGIHAAAKNPGVLAGKSFVVTPNTFVFALLTGKEVRALPHEERVKVVQEEAARLQTTILLKAAIDIASDGKEVLTNETGSPYMSGGGLGDTLSGIIGALLSRGISPMQAAAAGAYINGKAGEIAGAKLKESLTAMDVIDAIPQVIG